MTLQYRHALARSLPDWLSGPNAQSFFAEGLAVLYDVDRAWFQEALLNRFPSTCDPSALPLLLADRRLRRGPYTAEAAVRRYLRLWLDQWRLAGLFSGLLLATQAFLAPEYPQIRIWTRGQTCYTIAKGTTGRALALPGFKPLELGPDGDTSLGERLRWSNVITTAQVPAFTWRYDSISNPNYAQRWWHFWMTIHGPPTSAKWAYDTTVTYGDPLVSWSAAYPAGELATLRQIVRDYSPHETRPHSILLVEDEAEFDPLSPDAGDPWMGWPDGWWGKASKSDGNGGVIPARRTDIAYLESNEGD